MSSPQRQVGSRRLPPLPKASPSTVLKTGKSESPTGSKTSVINMYGKVSLELASSFIDGPFRPALSPQAFEQVLSSAENLDVNGAANGEKDPDGRSFIIPGMISCVISVSLGR